MLSKHTATRSRTGFLTGARRELLTGIAAMLLAASAGAQGNLAPGVRGPANGIATRTVSTFLDRERALQQAIDKRDTGTVKRMLDPDFEARRPSSQDTLSAQEWRTLAFRTQRRGIVRELSVYEVDDLAIVSFLLILPAARPAAQRPETQFIVDTWRKSTGTLLARSWDTPANPPALPDRPTGRE